MKKTLAEIALMFGMLSIPSGANAYKIGDEMPKNVPGSLFEDSMEFMTKDYILNMKTFALSEDKENIYEVVYQKCKSQPEDSNAPFKKEMSKVVFFYDGKKKVLLIDNKGKLSYSPPDGKIDRIVNITNPADLKKPVEPVFCGVWN